MVNLKEPSCPLGWVLMPTWLTGAERLPDAQRADLGRLQAQPPEIRGTGYVVQAIEAALWAFWNSDDFQEGALMAVNLGEDADTTGAIYGQLAGAYYGLNAIPFEWRKKIAMSNRILKFSDALYAFANRNDFSKEKESDQTT